MDHKVNKAGQMETHEIIKNLVQQVYKIDISRNCRTINYVQARAIYFKLCMDFTSMTIVPIASSVNKNHATLLHALKQFDVYLRFIPKFKENYNFIKGAFLEGQMFPHRDKRMTMDELIIKYNELIVEVDSLREKLEQSKTCSCGQCV